MRSDPILCIYQSYDIEWLGFKFSASEKLKHAQGHLLMNINLCRLVMVCELLTVDMKNKKGISTGSQAIPNSHHKNLSEQHLKRESCSALAKLYHFYLRLYYASKGNSSL